jgi:hypothetical protein
MQNNPDYPRNASNHTAAAIGAGTANTSANTSANTGASPHAGGGVSRPLGVELAIFSSSSVMSTEISANNGVLK